MKPMKTITFTPENKRQLIKDAKLFLKIFLIISIITGLSIGVYEVNNWFETHRFVFQYPVAVKTPVYIEIRKPIVIREKASIVTPVRPEEINTPIKHYICDKFGEYFCLEAVAIFSAESGLREDAVGINSNGTIDIGIAQINSVHFKQPGCSLKEIVNAEKNVDCAYNIFIANGKSWNAWVAYNTGSYLSKLNK